MDQQQIVASVKLREFITDSTHDTLLADIESEMRLKVLEYCHIDAVPDGLDYVLVSMVQDRFHQMLEKAGKSTGAISSVSDGQQSVSYKLSSDVDKQSAGDLDVLKGYTGILNKYRVVKFT